MKVFRICNKEEVKNILDTNSFENIGKLGSDLIKKQQEKDISNHKYEENEKYLHFFKNICSIFYLKTYNGYCICTYVIPEEVLDKGYGIGKYWDFINYDHLVDVEEYAIKTKDLKLEYLEKIDEINEYIDIEDYLYGYPIESFVTTTYNKTLVKKYCKYNNL